MRRLHASFGLLTAVVLLAALLAGSPTLTSASDDSAAPKFSTFASADDLAAEVKSLVADLEKAVVDEDEYKSQVEGRFVRDGNTITLIAIAVGLHDQDNPLKPHAKAIAAAGGNWSWSSERLCGDEAGRRGPHGGRRRPRRRR